MRTRLVIPLLSVAALSACATSSSTQGSSASATAPTAPASTELIQLAPDFQLMPLADGVWRHISHKDTQEFGRVSSNGLVVLGRDGVLLVDTAWTPAQTRLLLAWIDTTLRAPVRDVIVTHGHADRMGGVSELPSTTRVYARGDAVRRVAQDNATLSIQELQAEQTLELSGVRAEVVFPGHGHAPDNVLVSFADRGLLFGGCFVKDTGATTLGNVADADLASWRQAIAWTIARYPNSKVVVPGHGEPGGTELLRHTQQLLGQHAPSDGKASKTGSTNAPQQ